MKPKVSIIVPVYNTENTLRECVDSLLNQSLKEIEVILVDDGTPDEAGTICDEYMVDERIKVIHKENGGLSSARNAGLEVATGRYIGFVDSDDYVSADMFDKLYKQIDVTGSDICVCAHYTVDTNGEKVEHLFQEVQNVLEGQEIVEKMILPLIGPDVKNKKPGMEGFVWRCLYKQELLGKQRFESEREYFAEDVVFNLESYGKSKKICIVNECLYYYRYNPESLSNYYRNNIPVMLEKLLQRGMLYMRGSNIGNAEYCRLYATGIKFIIFSIHNLKKRNCPLSPKEKRIEIRTMLRTDVFSQCTRKIDIKFYNIKMKVFITLCRIRAVRLLLLLV